MMSQKQYLIAGTGHGVTPEPALRLAVSCLQSGPSSVAVDLCVNAK